MREISKLGEVIPKKQAFRLQFIYNQWRLFIDLDKALSRTCEENKRYQQCPFLKLD